MSQRMLRQREVQQLTGLSRSRLFEAVKDGKFPKPFAIIEGGRATGWFLDEVEAFIAERKEARDRKAVG
jgi:prophage regulatory protein